VKSKDLKKMLKPLVRECLTELFAEMKLESIVEGVIKKSSLTRGPSLSEALGRESQSQVVQEQRQVELTTEEKRDMLQKKLGISDDEWRSMYAGTEPLDENDSGGPELVSESVLHQAGLMKDYSKFVDRK